MAAVLAGGAAFAGPARAAEIDNARAYCAKENAHWVGGAQQCACDVGYAQSGNTCVSADAGSAGGAGGGFAIPPGALNSAIGGAVGTMLGNALVAPLANPYQGHVRPQPVVGDDDESAPDPAINSGMADVDGILKGYHPTVDDGAVLLSGETPMLLRAAESPPLISEDLTDIDDLSLPPEEAPAPADLNKVSAEQLNDWAAKASDEGKALITQTAALEQELADSAAGDALTAAYAARNAMQLMNAHTLDAPLITSETKDLAGLTNAELQDKITSTDAGQVLHDANVVLTGTTFVDACKNGLATNDCQGAAWGAGFSLSMNTGGTTMMLGATALNGGRNSINSYSRRLNGSIDVLETEGSLKTRADQFGTLRSQQQLNDQLPGFLRFYVPQSEIGQ